jgi:undecaprenyl-diphosphatase
MDAIRHLDLSALLWVNHFAQRSTFFDHMVEALLDQNFLQGGFFFLFIWWMWFRDPEKLISDRTDALRILVAVWSTIVVARALQILLPPVVRPLNDPTIPFVLPYAGRSGVAEHFSSFPSDHAIVFFALATAIWARYRWLGALAYVWVFVFACLSRVYAGFHYPSDIVVGAIIGMVFMRIADMIPLPRAANWFIDRIFSWERRHAAAFYCVAVAITYECISLFEDVRLIGRSLLKALS